MEDSVLPVFLLVAGGSLALIVFAAAAAFARWYKKVDQGRALIINKTGAEPLVTFTGGLVFPVIHRMEVMDISVKTLEIDRKGKDGLICRDNIRADIKVTFFVRVNKTSDDVLKVAQSIGCERASDQPTLDNLFTAKFSEALKTVGKQLDFEALYQERASFRDSIIQIIGKDLNGFVLEDAAIDYLEQTPVDHLDEKNILDAQGIRKITELTSKQNVFTNDLRQEERKAIKKQNVEAEEAVLALQKQEEAAKAKQKREIEILQAREAAESARVKDEERQKAELARLAADEEIAVQDQNRQRQVEVAAQNRLRVVKVEAERVAKEQQLEIVARERQVELANIEKEKALEVEKKSIADVVRERIAVDKTVAEEEERIKDLRQIAEANRNKDTVRIAAEAEAQENLVKSIKNAEAAEEAAKFNARTVLLKAEAELEASDKEAKAKIRLADALKAESAAQGLAQVQVRDATAAVIEREGAAEAAALREKGMAKVNVEEAEAGAIEKRGAAEALAHREKELAEALGIKERMLAEAAGLAEKAKSMKELDGVSREHEEFRMRLDKSTEVQFRNIEARVDIAQAQAEILREAFKTAKINIVGGDGEFFDKFVNAVSVGQQVDGVVDQSETVQQVMKQYLKGDASLPDDLKEILSRPALSADAVKSLTVSAVLGKMMTGVDGDTRGKLQSLIDRARELGVDNLDRNGS